MPLQKSIELDSGDTGEHFELNYFHWDNHRKEFSGHLSIYKSAAHRAAGKPPQRNIVAKVRALGTKFDQYFSSEALSKAGRNHAEQAYWVAQNDPECVISDYHKPDKPLFADAKIV